jgi:hypothetical protein
MKEVRVRARGGGTMVMMLVMMTGRGRKPVYPQKPKETYTPSVHIYIRAAVQRPARPSPLIFWTYHTRTPKALLKTHGATKKKEKENNAQKNNPKKQPTDFPFFSFVF